jgi:MYXO-CTERM domain-containing protein
MPSRRAAAFGLSFSVVVGLTIVAQTARANPGINGFSGKPNAFGTADTCATNCHQPTSPTPTLDVTVPSVAEAGTTHEVTIVVNGTRVRTALNAAFTDGVVAVAGQNTEVPFPDQDPEEVVSVTPPPSGATGTYKLSFVAPNRNGPITLWIAAMSASGAGVGGDGVVTTTRTITVTGATGGDEPDPEPVPEPNPLDEETTTADSGAGTSSSSGGSGAGPGRRPVAADAGGCAAAPAGRAPVSAVAPLLLLGLLLLARRRNARPRGGI